MCVTKVHLIEIHSLFIHFVANNSFLHIFAILHFHVLCHSLTMMCECAIRQCNRKMRKIAFLQLHLNRSNFFFCFLLLHVWSRGIFFISCIIIRFFLCYAIVFEIRFTRFINVYSWVNSFYWRMLIFHRIQCTQHITFMIERWTSERENEQKGNIQFLNQIFVFGMIFSILLVYYISNVSITSSFNDTTLLKSDDVWRMKALAQKKMLAKKNWFRRVLGI